MYKILFSLLCVATMNSSIFAQNNEKDCLPNFKKLYLELELDQKTFLGALLDLPEDVGVESGAYDEHPYTDLIEKEFRHLHYSALLLKNTSMECLEEKEGSFIYKFATENVTDHIGFAYLLLPHLVDEASKDTEIRLQETIRLESLLSNLIYYSFESLRG